MDDDEKQRRFEEAFRRGQEGQVSSYEAWLREQGFVPERVDATYLAEYYRSNSGSAPNHRDQLEELAEYIGYFSRREGTYHLPVIGVTGVGKTQLLHTVSYLVDQLDEDIEQRRYNAPDFGEILEGEEEQHLFYVLDELQSVNTAIIGVDDCGGDKRIKQSLSHITDRVDNCLLITTWTPEAWRRDQDRVNEAVLLSTEIFLEPFDERMTIVALSTAVDLLTDDGNLLPEETLQAIYEPSHGIPQLFTAILLETLHETFLKGLELGDVEAVDAAVSKLSLESAEERVYDVSDKQLTILKHVLHSYDGRGIRPTELVELLNIEKSTVSYHLQSLTAANILESEKSGRSVFYRIRGPMIPIVQQRLSQEGEFHA